MGSTSDFAARFWTDESGQDLIEYALIAALIGLGAVASLSNLSTSIGSALSSIGNSFSSST